MIAALRLLPNRNCATCVNQAEWGCEGVPYTVVLDDGEEEVRWHNGSALPLGVLGEDIYCCPRQDLKQNPLVWAAILKFYGMYQKGHFPDPGSVTDQSNKAIELFRIIDDANGACDKQEAEEAKARANRPNRAMVR